MWYQHIKKNSKILFHIYQTKDEILGLISGNFEKMKSKNTQILLMGG